MDELRLSIRVSWIGKALLYAAALFPPLVSLVGTNRLVDFVCKRCITYRVE